jgi:WD40 repeat protein
MVDLVKRRFLKQSLSGLSVCGVATVWDSALLAGCSKQNNFGLQTADSNGLRLPAGFSSRIIANSGQAVISGRDFIWHAAPDGGACFAIDSGSYRGGWIYVSNSEVQSTGGAGAIVFNAGGEVVDAYSILENTSRNCAGGATPWGSWLSCEEIDDGRVWECFPEGRKQAIVRPALGVFNHEAVAVDEVTQYLYLTEDKVDGCLYRFIADSLAENGFPDLSAGLLEVAVQGDKSSVSWVAVPDPLAKDLATRYQVASVKTFNGGEGIAYYNGKIIFTTKGDNRVWFYNTKHQLIGVLYDVKQSLTPILTGVDNITVSQQGDIYVAEDGGDLQIVVIDNQGRLYPIAQLDGHDDSEITGVAFSPDAKRLYFSSQRGATGFSENGVSYEIQGF